MSGLFVTLEPFLPALAILLVVLAVVIFVYVIVLLRRMSAEPEEKAEAKTYPLAKTRKSAHSLKESFRRAVADMRHGIVGRDYRYRIPWVAMVGEQGSGKTAALGNSGLVLRGGRPADEFRGGKPPCNWWLFDDGAVLDLAGSMVLGSQGETEEGEKRYAALIKYLQRYRSGRPLDGIVLAIPATDFVGPDKLEDDHLAAKAKHLFLKLHELQSRLEMRLPLYILITKCDVFTGFEGFWRRADADRLKEMIGWSNPHGFAEAYDSGWVEVGFDALRDQLLDVRLDFLASGGQPDNPDEIFQFPNELLDLREKISRFVDGIMKPSVYFDAFGLRGFYFCGNAPGGEGTPAFVNHLLRFKVFPECGLAIPMGRGILSRNRQKLSLQITAAVVLVVGVFGLWLTNSNLAPHATDVGMTLGSIYRKFESSPADTLVPGANETVTEQAMLRAVGLVDDISKMRGGTFADPLLPASWFSSLDENIIKFLDRAQRKVVINTMAHRFRTKARALLEAAPEEVTPPGGAAWTEAYRTLEEFKALRTFVEKVRELEHHLSLYRHLATPGSANLDEFVELVKFLFDQQIGPEIYQDEALYRQALERIRGERINLRDEYGQRMISRAVDLTRRFMDRLFLSGPVEADLIRTRPALNAFLSGSPPTESQARTLHGALSGLQGNLSRPDMAWVWKKELALGAPYDVVRESVQESRLLGEPTFDAMTEMGDTGFKKLRARLTALNGTSRPDLAVQDDQGHWGLAPEVAVLQGLLNDTLNLGFMRAPVDVAPVGTFGPGRKLQWDSVELTRALAYVSEFEAFQTDNISKLDVLGAGAVSEMAGRRAVEAILAAVEAAKRAVPREADLFGADAERTIGSEIQYLKKAAEPLRALMTSFSDRVAVAVKGAVRDQALRLLEALTLMEEQDGLYLPKRSLSGWEGKSTPLMVGYGIGGGKALDAYLAGQRARIAYLADNYARPLLNLLEYGPPDSDVASSSEALRWRIIIQELERGATADPESGPVKLETFFKTKMAVMDQGTCLAELGAEEIQVETGDYFSDRLESLRGRVLARCRAMVDGVLLARYAVFAERFDKDLAGRFPFASPGPDPVTGVTAQDADPAVVRRFFKAFDKESKGLLEQLTALPAHGEETAFVDGLVKAQAFLGPVLGLGPAEVPPNYVGTVSFRVNRKAEHGGSMVLNWSFTSALQTLDSSTPDNKFNWQVGDAVTVRMHLAADAPLRPSPSQVATGPTVEGTDVIFEEKGPWALLRLLALHKTVASDVVMGEGPLPHTLRFAFSLTLPPLPVVNGQSPGPFPLEPTAAAEEGLVFLRLSLAALGAKAGDETPLGPLPQFPTKSPTAER